MKFQHWMMGMGALVLASAVSTRAQSFLDYTGGSYTQNFNSLIYSNNVSLQARNPASVNGSIYTFSGVTNGVFDFAAAPDTSSVTNGSTGGLGLSSTMAGWYGSAQLSPKYGAQAGAETQGGIYNFGGLTSTNRSLGLMSANGSGITTFGLKLVNDTGVNITTLNLSFVGELWKQQTTAKSLNFGFVVTNTFVAMPLTVSPLGAVSFASGSSASLDGTLSANQTNISLSSISIGNWENGDALWLTWQTSSAAGSSQGIAIDNLVVSPLVVVPEPSTVALVGLGLAGMMVIRRRRRSA